MTLNVYLGMLFVCAATAAGCSSESPSVAANPKPDTDASASGSSGSSSGSGSRMDASTSASLPDGESPIALPCNNIHSGFAGDEQCLLPPDPALGTQFHYGPADYNDPEQMKRYTLMPGQEVTDCVYLPLTNKKTVYVNEYHGRMRPGSHHFIFYTSPAAVTETPPGGAPDPACTPLFGTNVNYVMGAQQATLDIVGNVDGAPENNNMAQATPPGLQGILQFHFINTHSYPILREAWINSGYVKDPSTITQLMNQMYFLGGLKMDVPMGTTQIIKGSAMVPASAGPGFRVLALAPHSHTHTTHWVVYATIAGQRKIIMESFNPLHAIPEPDAIRYDSVTKNPAPNDTTMTGGGTSGILYMKPGDLIDWTCEVQNDDVPGGITFQNSVLTGEMCNLFGFYAPTTPEGTWSAFNN